MSRDGERWNVKTRTLIKNNEINFKLGEEFDEQRIDDVTVKSLVVRDGNKVIQTQTQPNSKIATITREFTEKFLTTTCTINGVTSVRVYERLTPVSP